MIRRRGGGGVPYGYIIPTRREMVEGGETNVDAIFDKLKSEMLLVKKDTIAAWVEEFGGEPTQEEEGGGVTKEAGRIDGRREEAARGLQRVMIPKAFKDDYGLTQLDTSVYVVEALETMGAVTPN